MTWDKVLEVIAKFVEMILPLVSPELRKMLEESLKKFMDKAVTTENPWDDYLAKFLLAIFDIDYEPNK